MSEAPPAGSGTESLHLLARLAATLSAVIFFSTSATPALERALAGRPIELSALLVPLVLVLAYASMALAPWPREGWSGVVLIAVAYLGPGIALMSADPDHTRRRLLPLLLLVVPCQVALIRTGIAWRRQGKEPGRSYARSPLFWALVWTAASPGALLLEVALLVPYHPVSTESRTIGSLRSFVSAQVTYQSVGSGAFGSPRCLLDPQQCIAGYPVNAPVMADPEMLEAVRAGYLRTFHPVPAAGDDLPPIAEPLRGYAVLAVPVEPHRPGSRSFCADSSGRICSWHDGGVPQLEAGGCPQECESIY